MTKKNELTNCETSSVASSFYMEAQRSGRGMSILLSGIIGISDFNESNILLQSHGGRISVNGKRLHIKVYDRGSVEIIGKVSEIGFKYGKN